MKKFGWDFVLKLAIIIWVIIIGIFFFLKFDFENQNTLPNDLVIEQIPVESIIIKKTEPEIYYPISTSEKEIVEYIVAGEAKGESLLGKMAVAQCILNAMKQDNLTASEVREIYQYSGWDDQLKYLNTEAWNEVCHAVWCVFDNGEVVTQENILWFYNPNISEGKFHNTQKFVLEIGNHRFYAPYP